jgi:hypothetical protein
METQFATVDFHGQTLLAIQNGDEIRVALKPICENIGLTWHGQFERINRIQVLKESVRVIRMLSADSKQRELVTLPLEMINGWLFGVDASRVSDEVRPKLIEYQRECFNVLYSYWHKGTAQNPRQKTTTPATTTPTATLSVAEYQAQLERQGLVLVDRKDYQQWQVAVEFGGDPYKPYREATEWVLKVGHKHGRGAVIALLSQFDTNYVYYVPLKRLPELVASCKRILGEQDVTVIQAAPAADQRELPQQQLEEIVLRLTRLGRLFSTQSAPFDDVLGLQQVLCGIDPLTATLREDFVPVMTEADFKNLPESSEPDYTLSKRAAALPSPLHQQAMQALRARYTHGDYNALAHDLGIHSSSAKKILARLNLGLLHSEG